MTKGKLLSAWLYLGTEWSLAVPLKSRSRYFMLRRRSSGGNSGVLSPRAVDKFRRCSMNAASTGGSWEGSRPLPAFAAPIVPAPAAPAISANFSIWRSLRPGPSRKYEGRLSAASLLLRSLLAIRPRLRELDPSRLGGRPRSQDRQTQPSSSPKWTALGPWTSSPSTWRWR
jgi:hypothetical protein